MCRCKYVVANTAVEPHMVLQSAYVFSSIKPHIFFERLPAYTIHVVKSLFDAIAMCNQTARLPRMVVVVQPSTPGAAVL